MNKAELACAIRDAEYLERCFKSTSTPSSLSVYEIAAVRLLARVRELEKAAKGLKFVHNSNCDVYDFDPCLALGGTKPCNCGMNAIHAALDPDVLK